MQDAKMQDKDASEENEVSEDNTVVEDDNTEDHAIVIEEDQPILDMNVLLEGLLIAARIKTRMLLLEL